MRQSNFQKSLPSRTSIGLRERFGESDWGQGGFDKSEIRSADALVREFFPPALGTGGRGRPRSFLESTLDGGLLLQIGDAVWDS